VPCWLVLSAEEADVVSVFGDAAELLLLEAAADVSFPVVLEAGAALEEGCVCVGGKSTEKSTELMSPMAFLEISLQDLEYFIFR
jgi:hypothetical protein